MNPPGRKASEGDGETKVAYHTPATISVTVAYYHESSTVFVLHLLHSLKERNLIWTSSFALIIRRITKQFYPRFTPGANYFPASQEDFSLSTANVQDGARLDIVMNGFWGRRSERAFVDVRVFNPFAPSNAASSLSACYKKHENSKKRAYGQRIREIENASFTPVVMSATGGLAHEATCFYKRLASLLSHKWGDEYSVVMGWLRCSLSFSLLRSAIQCVRGPAPRFDSMFRLLHQWT